METVTRCYFCGTQGFIDLDEVTMHMGTVDSKGVNICTGIKTSLDPRGQEPLFPMKIEGRKYAAKNHDGTYMMYSREGKISKTKLVRYLLS